MRYFGGRELYSGIPEVRSEAIRRIPSNNDLYKYVHDAIENREGFIKPKYLFCMPAILKRDKRMCYAAFLQDGTTMRKMYTLDLKFDEPMGLQETFLGCMAGTIDFVYNVMGELGEDSIKTSRESKFYLIFVLDPNMYFYIKRIASWFNSQTVLVMKGWKESIYLQRYISILLDQYHQKPFSVSKLNGGNNKAFDKLNKKNMNMIYEEVAHILVNDAFADYTITDPMDVLGTRNKGGLYAISEDVTKYYYSKFHCL